MENLELPQNADKIKKSPLEFVPFCEARLFLFKTCVILTVFSYFLKYS